MNTTSSCHSPSSVWTVPEPFRNIYSHAVELPVGKRLLFISGQVGVAPDGRVAEDFSTQAEQAMDNVEALLVAARMTIAEVVKLTYYVTNSQNLATLGEIRRRRWSSRTPPAVTALIIAGLARSEYLIEIEAIAAAN